MKYAFFPGCSLESTAWDFDRSTRAVCLALGIELEDIPDWVCCGSTPAHASDPALAMALPVVNLQKAQAAGLPVMTACASCYARLRTANHTVHSDPEKRRQAERVTGKPYDGSVEVQHVLDVLVNHFGIERIRAAVGQAANLPPATGHRARAAGRRPAPRLSGLRVACYYGCLLTRPPEVVAFDDPEHPHSMDDLVAAAGAEPVDWPYKTECCGASLSMTNCGVVTRLGHRLLTMARQAGAECIAVACPLCQVNLDLRQADAVKAHGAGKGDSPRLPERPEGCFAQTGTVPFSSQGSFPPTPVLYVTQILGLALGLSEEELGMRALTVSAGSLLGERGQAAAAAKGGMP